MTEIAMPAAASFEDIYQTSSSSTAASSLGSSASLPGSGGGGAYDYMAMYHLDSSQEKVATPIKTGKLSSDVQLKVNKNNANNRQLNSNKTRDTYQQPEVLGRRRGSYQSQTSYQQQLIELPQEYYNDYYYYGIDENEMENIRTLQHNNSHNSSSSSSNCNGRARSATLTSTTTTTSPTTTRPNNNYNNLTCSSMFTFTEDNDFDDDQLATCIQQSKDSSFALAATLMTPPAHQHYLTLEELKMAHSSCWLCGCNWQQDHVSLDCQECGGYALTRPCPKCDGKCKQQWERNITLTHDHHRASWIGQCQLSPSTTTTTSSIKTTSSSSLDSQAKTTTTTTSTATMLTPKDLHGCCKRSGELNNSNGLQKLASSCCSSQTSSAASSDSEQ